MPRCLRSEKGHFFLIRDSGVTEILNFTHYCHLVVRVKDVNVKKTKIQVLYIAKTFNQGQNENTKSNN